MSRALANLIEHADLIEAMFKELVDRLRQLVPELGRHLGFDGKAIPTFSTGRKNRETGETTDPEADWGMKKYRGEEANGKPWEKLTSFGRVVRVSLDQDYRLFTPIPRDTPTWKRLYAQRTAIERVNARVDQVFGFEHHTIRGLAKMRLRVGLALAVMLALAVGSIAEKKPELMRFLVGKPRPLRKAA